MHIYGLTYLVDQNLAVERERWLEPARSFICKYLG